MFSHSHSSSVLLASLKWLCVLLVSTIQFSCTATNPQSLQTTPQNTVTQTQIQPVDVGYAHGVLRVCADPNNLPFSNRKQEGFENKIAAIVARDLGAQLENPAVAKGFARDYTRMWDQRYRSLASALERGDLAGSMDAVLSLKTSSAMVGGLRLAQLAGELENALRAGDIGRALSLLRDVAARGGETVDELQFSYVLWDS